MLCNQSLKGVGAQSSCMRFNIWWLNFDLILTKKNKTYRRNRAAFYPTCSARCSVVHDWKQLCRGRRTTAGKRTWPWLERCERDDHLPVREESNNPELSVHDKHIIYIYILIRRERTERDEQTKGNVFFSSITTGFQSDFKGDVKIRFFLYYRNLKL